MTAFDGLRLHVLAYCYLCELTRDWSIDASDLLTVSDPLAFICSGCDRRRVMVRLSSEQIDLEFNGCAREHNTKKSAGQS